MRLLDDWDRVVKKAWSFRLLALAAVFTVAEILLPLVGAEMPPVLFSVLSGLAIVGAMITRVIAQKEFER
jgi:hypothetical protein